MGKTAKFLCLLLAAALLAGCTPTESDTTAAEQTAGETGTSTDGATTVEAEETFAVKDESDVLSVSDSDLFTYTLGNTLTYEETAVTQSELLKTAEWFEKYVMYTGQDGVVPAYDFKIGTVSVRDILSDFTFERSGGEQEVGSCEAESCTSTVTATRADGLTFTVVGTLYKSYPVCEWTVYITNGSQRNTGKISDFYALDYSFECVGQTVINGNKGSCDDVSAYTPFEKALTDGKSATYDALYGKSSYAYLPFFALTTNTYNAVVGIGWTGQWQAAFTRSGDTLNARVYQERLNAELYPGESIRSPLVSVQFYNGSYVRGQNIFRSWVLNDVYRDDAQEYVLGAPIRFDLMQNATAESFISDLDNMVKRDIKADFLWMDAGWYQLTDGSWVSTGSWTADKKRFPNGISEITAKAAGYGIRSVLWYEPERVVTGQFLSVGRRNKWLLKADTAIGGNVSDGWYLWNLSDDAAFTYLCEYMSASLKENGVSVYRQDANSDPLAYWVRGDIDFYDGRTGICENRYVTNFYKYWDYLLEHNEGLIIDNCASGGRRLDLETIRRSITVWRCDYCHDTTAQQIHTGGLSAWLPLHGTGTIHSNCMAASIGGGQPETYVFRSQMSPLLLLSWNFDDGSADWDTLVGELNTYLSYRQNYLGNFYELTSHSKSKTTYYALQFCSTDGDGGMALIYRRENAGENYFRLLLTGLHEDEIYDMYSIDDTDTVYSYSGKRLMTEGVPIPIGEAPAAEVFIYEV